jgi:hypothetical protein
LAQLQTTDRQFSLMIIATFLSLILRVIGSIAGPIILIIAARKIMVGRSQWPGYVILVHAIYALIAYVPFILIHPIIQNLGWGLRIETYAKITTILSPISWIMSLASAIAILTVCRRLAQFSKSHDNQSA